MTNTCCDYKKTAEDINRRYSVEQLLQHQHELNELVISGWEHVLSPCNFQVAMMDEFCEILGSGVDWKHWKYSDPALFDEFNVKVEIVDVAFFYLSLMIMWMTKHSTQSDYCSTDGRFNQFDSMYVGVDKGRSFSGIGLLSGNKLQHCAFVELQAEAMVDQNDVFMHIDTLDKIVSSMGLSATEFSALYAAKETLNRFRQSEGYKDGTYVKVSDGIEDNERLQPLVEAFMSDASMTLTTLKQNVEDAFFETTTV